MTKLKGLQALLPKVRFKKFGSLAPEQTLHLEEMERLNREIPLPSGKTRGFVFNK